MKPVADSRAQWRRLRSAGAGNVDLGVPSVELDVSTATGPLRLAVGRGGEPALLIPLYTAEPVANLPVSRSLSAREVVLAIGGAPCSFLELSCEESRLEGVFEQLVEEVIRRIGSGEAALPSVVGTITEFRDLLDKPPGGMSVEAMIGLIGELVTLTDLLRIAPTAWKAWNGPLAGRHDFRSGPTAIECKTTRRTSSGSVTIAAVDQLEAPRGGDLLLRVLVVEPDAGGDLSLETLARHALDLASDPPALSERLATAGWAADAPGMETPFSCLADSWYRVLDGFPRIIPDTFSPSGLPAGVVALTYSVQLDAAAPFRIEAPDAAPYLEALAHAA